MQRLLDGESLSLDLDIDLSCSVQRLFDGKGHSLDPEIDLDFAAQGCWMGEVTALTCIDQNLAVQMLLDGERLQP